MGAYRFMPSCGLYFLAACAEEKQGELLERLVRALGTGGIGGKVSAGYGTFVVDDVILLNEPFDAQTDWLYTALTMQSPKHYLLLTTSLPTDGELEDVLDGAYYQLARRGGYVQSNTFSSTQADAILSCSRRNAGKDICRGLVQCGRCGGASCIPLC